jgi:hypothetical protein
MGQPGSIQPDQPAINTSEQESSDMVISYNCYSVCSYLFTVLAKNTGRTVVNLKNRHTENLLVRAAMMNAARLIGKFNYPEIASFFGKTHATVINSVKKHEVYLRMSIQYKQDFTLYTNVIRELKLRNGLVDADAYDYRLQLKLLNKRVKLLEKELSLYKEAIPQVLSGITVANLDVAVFNAINSKLHEFMESEKKKEKAEEKSNTSSFV